MTLGEKIKELQEIEKEYGSDILIISKSDNYELGGSYEDDNSKVKVMKMSKIERNFRDDFDGTRYTSKVYEYDENGNMVVLL